MAQAKLRFETRQAELRRFYAARSAQNKIMLDRMILKAEKAPMPPHLELKPDQIPGELIDPPGPPVFVSIDKQSGPPATPFQILAANFFVQVVGRDLQPHSAPPRLIVMIAKDVLKDAEVVKWTNTEIIATVPDTTGFTAYDGYIRVKTQCGEGNSKPFKTDPEMEEAELPSHESSFHTIEFSCPSCNGFDEAPKDPGTGYQWAGRVQHIHSSHVVPFTSRCSGTDEYRKGMKLKNGWTVSGIKCDKLDESTASSIELVD